MHGLRICGWAKNRRGHYAPYRISLDSAMGEKELQIVVANTAANACARTDYFERHDIKDVGPYHANMVIQEAKQPGGGLLGPLTLYKLI